MCESVLINHEFACPHITDQEFNYLHTGCGSEEQSNGKCWSKLEFCRNNVKA